MKTIQITFVLLAAAAAILFVREGRVDSPLVEALPFLGGHKPGIFDVAGVIMILVTIWGLGRVIRHSRRG